MLTLKESNALNFLRWFSTAAIVLCHLLQGYGNDWCYVANIGVQVFFFLSGFLYGGKKLTGGFRTFYWGRFVKIYVPYVIWVILAVTLMWWLSSNPPELKSVVKQLVLITNISGMGQMWFLTVLFVCYLVLPIVDQHIHIRPVITIIVLAAMIALWWYFRYSPFVVWVALYYVGYICGHWPKSQVIVLFGSFCVSILLLSYHGLSLEFFKSNSLDNNIVHALCGIVVSLGFYLSLRQFDTPKLISHILTNGGGYEVYLTHCLYIFGPLTVLHITSYRLVNIAIFFAVTVISSLVLCKLSCQIQQYLNKIQ